MKRHNYLIDSYFSTDVGRVRLVNEDQVTILFNKNGEILMLVCDGMGGQNKGDYASNLTLKFISEKFKKKKESLSIVTTRIWLEEIINKANKLVFSTGESSSIYKGMGTTIVAAIIRKNNIVIVNAGDSRAYMYKDKVLNKLSVDHSVVERLKQYGKINENEANKRLDKNVLTNALGIYPSISFNSKIYKYNNEPILLCSDGIFNNLSDREIIEIISLKISAKDKVIKMIANANRNGGSDNLSVAYLERKDS